MRCSWSSNSNTVSVISDATNSVVATVNVGSSPDGAAYDSGQGEVFVANSGSNTVSVISDSSNTVTAAVNVGSNPFGVAYDSGKGEVFVPNFGSNTVSVISDAPVSVPEFPIAWTLPIVFLAGASIYLLARRMTGLKGMPPAPRSSSLPSKP